jgi:hypothetical protein
MKGDTMTFTTVRINDECRELIETLRQQLIAKAPNELGKQVWLDATVGVLIWHVVEEAVREGKASKR